MTKREKVHLKERRVLTKQLNEGRLTKPESKLWSGNRRRENTIVCEG